jgi:hypothetical protein
MDYSNPFLTPIPFVLLCDQDIHKRPSLITQSPSILPLISNEPPSSIDILFENSQSFDVLIQLLSTSKSSQLSILEILCCLCINNERQKQLVEKDIIPAIMQLLVQNISDSHNNIVR